MNIKRAGEARILDDFRGETVYEIDLLTVPLVTERGGFLWSGETVEGSVSI